MKKIVKGTLLAGVAAMMLLALGTDVLAQRSQTFRVDAGTRFRVE